METEGAGRPPLDAPADDATADAQERTTAPTLAGEGAAVSPAEPSGTPPAQGPAPGTEPPDSGGDRQAAFTPRPPSYPRKALFLFVGALAMAVLLVTVVDHFVGPASTATTAQPTNPTTVITTPVAGGVGASNATFHSAIAPSGTAQLGSSMAALLGLQSLHDRTAPAWTLTDAATGKPVSLASMHGHAVVLSFVNGNCQDICPVLASELEKASAQLGTTPVPVTFVTVNADPLLVPPAPSPILHIPAFQAMARWRFLTGTVRTLNPVWKAYGISITVDDATNQVSHNDLLYFISPAGKLVWSAQPFADESQGGTYSLRPAQITRFAKGIAAYTRRLARTAT